MFSVISGIDCRKHLNGTVLLGVNVAVASVIRAHLCLTPFHLAPPLTTLKGAALLAP